ncbi:MAG: DUF3540 domain-containing protein [Sandaracinaceae bacterium]|nr:DUF3540 domain-containing protein [Sandaracinaceae bacterium]
MQTAAKTANTVFHETFQETGCVVRTGNGRALVETSSGELDARLAASCLVEPEVGDTVLLAVPARGDLYVLAILERAAPEAPLRIRSDCDVSIESSGVVSLSGTQGVRARSAHTLELAAKKLAVSAIDGMVSIDRLGVVGRFIETHADTVKTVLGTFDSFLERFSQHVKRSYRFVEEADVTRARQIDTRAQETMTMRGRNTFLSAEELMKLDGEQVHLG